MSVQGNYKDNRVVFTLKPWALQFGKQFFRLQSHILSLPHISEKQQTIIVPIYYTITDFLLLPVLLKNKLNTELKIIVPTHLINTPLGNYISQRGLDSYNIQNDLQRWLSDLQQQNICFLWFPQKGFVSKEQGLKYRLGLEPIEGLLNQIQIEYKTLWGIENHLKRNYYFINAHYYPSVFDNNPLENICDVSYEELAYGALKEFDVQNTLLDENHIIEVVFQEYSDLSKTNINATEIQNLLHLFHGKCSPDFEGLLYKLVTHLFPTHYSWKNFRNRFLSLLEVTIEKQGSPIRDALKIIYKKISTGEDFPPWDRMLEFLEKQRLCKKEIEGIRIKATKSFREQIKSVFFSLISFSNQNSDTEKALFRKIKWSPNFILSYTIAKKFYEEDNKIFEEDFTRSFHPEWSKNADVGRPFFHHVIGSRIGIVLSHGYLSAPMEIKALADYLYRQGYSVYGIRMKGHGTSPLDLAHSTHEEWYSALNRGIACLRARCEKVFLCGFSAGGCLVLSASAHMQKEIEGVISISAPLKLQNYAINLVPTISTLNLVLKKFGGSGWELFDHHPENPHINYQKNPLAGLQQLRLLMEKTEELLPQVTVPTLIIQGSNDTTVNPDSAHIIFQSISSEQKKLIFFNRTRHGILNGPGSEEIFITVNQFIKEITQNKVTGTTII